MLSFHDAYYAQFNPNETLKILHHPWRQLSSLAQNDRKSEEKT